MEVFKHIPKQRVFTDLDHEPTDEEIPKAVLGLNFSGPGDSGVAAAEWKALMADDECSEFVFAYVRRFWRSKVNHELWITGLLKILEKKGDLSKADNYRGIMVLEVPYKVVADVLKVRLGTVFESLGEHVESQKRVPRRHLEPEDDTAQAVKSWRLAGKSAGCCL
jgi:hypothetical protein